MLILLFCRPLPLISLLTITYYIWSVCIIRISLYLSGMIISIWLILVGLLVLVLLLGCWLVSRLGFVVVRGRVFLGCSSLFSTGLFILAFYIFTGVVSRICGLFSCACDTGMVVFLTDIFRNMLDQFSWWNKLRSLYMSPLIWQMLVTIPKSLTLTSRRCPRTPNTTLPRMMQNFLINSFDLMHLMT